ncbi:hypothetical protein ACQ4PT_065322 [Festuca glaucescens]
MDRASGVGGGGGMPPPQQMPDAVGLAAAADPQFVLLRNNIREKIFDYLGRKQMSADWRQRLPELTRRLEKVLFRIFPNKSEYYNMTLGPIEPHLQYAIKLLIAQNREQQRYQEMSTQIASSMGYGTIIPAPGMTRGASENSGVSYVIHNMDPSSSGAGMVPQNACMGTSLPAADPQFVLLRNNIREKIFAYIGRKQTSADWRRRLPELARRLEEILFRKFPNKSEYYNMMLGPIEPHLQYAIKFLSAQNAQRQRDLEMSRQIASSPGITQGASENSGVSYVTHNMGPSSSGAGMVHQNAYMGASLSGGDC